jgi:hypothetical protein
MELPFWLIDWMVRLPVEGLTALSVEVETKHCGIPSIVTSEEPEYVPQGGGPVDDSEEEDETTVVVKEREDVDDTGVEDESNDETVWLSVVMLLSVVNVFVASEVDPTSKANAISMAETIPVVATSAYRSPRVFSTRPHPLRRRARGKRAGGGRGADADGGGVVEPDCIVIRLLTLLSDRPSRSIVEVPIVFQERRVRPRGARVVRTRDPEHAARQTTCRPDDGGVLAHHSPSASSIGDKISRGVRRRDIRHVASIESDDP